MSEQQVVIKKRFNAPIEKVFQAWVDPKSMMQWYSPEGMTTHHAEADVRVGGAYAVTMLYNEKRSEQQTIVRGIYKEIERPTKLRFSWQWDGQEDITEVIVELRKISGSQTELTLTHGGFENKSYKTGFALADHKNGWNTAFNKLEVLMGGGE